MDSGFIRRLNLNDLKRVIELERICFNKYSAYHPKQIRYLLKYANSSCLAEVLDGYIRGFIIILFRNRSGVAGIETINVDPLFRGRGIAKKLLYAAEKEMQSRAVRRVRLEVSAGNASAINLYEKSGFRKVSLLKDYYKYGFFGTNDAFRMVKELTT